MAFTIATQGTEDDREQGKHRTVDKRLFTANNKSVKKEMSLRISANNAHLYTYINKNFIRVQLFSYQLCQLQNKSTKEIEDNGEQDKHTGMDFRCMSTPVMNLEENIVKINT